MPTHNDPMVNITIDFESITRLFTEAANEGRNSLFEYETYELLKNSGAETPPRTHLLLKDTHPSDEDLLSIPGDKVVLKIVSPFFLNPAPQNLNLYILLGLKLSQ